MREFAKKVSEPIIISMPIFMDIFVYCIIHIYIIISSMISKTIVPIIVMSFGFEVLQFLSFIAIVMYGFIIKLFVIIKYLFEDDNVFILILITLKICLIMDVVWLELTLMYVGMVLITARKYLHKFPLTNLKDNKIFRIVRYFIIKVTTETNKN